MKMGTRTVMEIVELYLRLGEFDGLYNDECSCFLDDLMPCGEYCASCQPGYRVENPDRSEGGWAIFPDPPEKPKRRL